MTFEPQWSIRPSTREQLKLQHLYPFRGSRSFVVRCPRIPQQDGERVNRSRRLTTRREGPLFLWTPYFRRTRNATLQTESAREVDVFVYALAVITGSVDGNLPLAFFYDKACNGAFLPGHVDSDISEEASLSADGSWALGPPPVLLHRKLARGMALR